jgi:hypothetical protein
VFLRNYQGSTNTLHSTIKINTVWILEGRWLPHITSLVVITKRPRPIVVKDVCASFEWVVVAFNTTSKDAPTWDKSRDSEPSLDSRRDTGEMGALCGSDSGDTELASDRGTDDLPSSVLTGARTRFGGCAS